jgi:hypothetical protein
LIHIGYHKTGSSWLQNQVFAEPGMGFDMPWQPIEIIEQLILSNPFAYDPETTFERFRGEIERARSHRRVPVLSHEMLSGNPRRGLMHGRLNADRLAETFPGARILIVIREQREIIRSWYKHHVRAGSSVPLSKWLAPPGRGFEPRFALDHFRYDLAIKHYDRLFGPDRVLVLPYEMLKADPAAFVRRITRFTGAEAQAEPRMDQANRSYSALAVELRRLANKLNGREFVSARRSFLDRQTMRLAEHVDRCAPRRLTERAEQRLRRRVRQIIGDRFAASNRETSHITGLDLAAFGYPC